MKVREISTVIHKSGVDHVRSVEVEGEGEVFVRSYAIIGTKTRVYDAWKRAKSMIHDFATITFLQVEGEEALVGQVGTDRLPADIDSLPAYSTERSDAVGRFHEQRGDVAIRAIKAAFPELDDADALVRSRVHTVEVRGGYAASVETHGA